MKKKLWISLAVILVLIIIGGLVIFSQHHSAKNSKTNSVRTDQTKGKSKSSKKTTHKTGNDAKINDNHDADADETAASNSTNDLTQKNTTSTKKAEPANNSSIKSANKQSTTTAAVSNNSSRSIQSDNNQSANAGTTTQQPASSQTTATPQTKNTVNNASEAIAFVSNSLGNNNDISYEVVSTDNNSYEIQAISKSIKNQGGSGTVGLYLVYPNGTYTLK